MRQFRVVVDGTEYCVEVDEISTPNVGLPVTEERKRVKDLKARTGESQPIGSSPSVFGDSKTITAPLAGAILSVGVEEGDHVKAGDIVLTLEALKLENEIITPYSGVVRSVGATVGQNVNAGDVLVVIDEI
ncbi:MAG TPA: biotin/lipoyl-binding protein [Corynebacteriales bacterium]|nr:biotin/lipoyl-binding protein [Mycobacteriales bacterium]